jgi:hypothetical protein
MRRDVYILVPAPGRKEEAERALQQWLVELDEHPGYLGGAVLREYAGELAPDTLGLVMDFETVEDGRALWKALKGKAYPTASDVPDGAHADQGWILFTDRLHAHDGGHGHTGSDEDHTHEDAVAANQLEYNRGGGLFARLLHGHFEVAHLYTATRGSAAAAAASR